MIALTRQQEKAWHIYITYNFSYNGDNSYQLDITTRQEIDFGRFARYNRGDIIGGIENISGEEKDGMMGIFNGEATEKNYLFEILNRLNQHLQINPQLSLENVHMFVCRKLESRFSEMTKEKP